MTDRPRGKADARGDAREFKETLGRARAELGRLPGVVSVGAGQKETAGEYRDHTAIVVVVSRKKPDSELSPSERIPSTFDGYPTDVVEVAQGESLGCNNTTEYSTIQGGIQIVPVIKSTDGTFAEGTLGCIVRRRGDTGRDNVYLLTNKHVLYVNGSKEDDYVYHPFAPPSAGFGSAGPSNVLGPIQSRAFHDNVKYRVQGAAADIDIYVDCATARIDIDSTCCGSTCTKDTTKYDTTIIDLDVVADDTTTPAKENLMVADVRSVIDDGTIVGQPVYKVGRTTGKTAGILRLLADAVDVNPGDGRPTIHAVTLIKIDFDTASTTTHVNCLANERFAEHGDSGSILVDAQGRAIGIIAIGPPKSADTAPPPRKYAAWACHIAPVLDLLEVCIPTSGGSSHGSCAATDGSGIPALGDFEAGPAGIDFAASNLVDSVPALANSVPISDDERTRLLSLRSGLRESAAGRELHDTFADVRREIGYLVRNSRGVKVAWHRQKGPAFLAHTLNHLKGKAEMVPLEIEGMTREALLERMARVLALYGSRPLKESIARYESWLMPILSSATTVQECLDALRDQPAKNSSEADESDGAALPLIYS